MKFSKVVYASAVAAMVAGAMSTAALAEDTYKFGGIGPVTGAAAAYGS